MIVVRKLFGNKGFIRFYHFFRNFNDVFGSLLTAFPFQHTPFMILKRDFAIDNGLDEEKLTLVFDSERINPQETVDTLGIEDGDCIDVYIK